MRGAGALFKFIVVRVRFFYDCCGAGAGAGAAFLDCCGAGASAGAVFYKLFSWIGGAGAVFFSRFLSEGAKLHPHPHFGVCLQYVFR